jgi:hypothetical protein
LNACRLALGIIGAGTTTNVKDGDADCFYGNSVDATNWCIQHTKNCCIGTDACIFVAATICKDSCDGTRPFGSFEIKPGTCKDLGQNAFIGIGSCIGEYACEGFKGNVGTGSCLTGSWTSPRRTCKLSESNIGDHSCIGDRSCSESKGDIGNGSCLDDGQGDSCRDSEGNIGAGSCLQEFSCRRSKGNIGAGSCLYKNSCKYSEGNIGNSSCIGLDNYSSGSCEDSKGDIEADSCLDKESCKFSEGNIGNSSCEGIKSCFQALIDIPDDVCTAANSCYGIYADPGDGNWPV